jgi:predicted ester cyclase
MHENADLATRYRAYIDCLNRQDWPSLGIHVADDAEHNGRPFGLEGYRAMLEQDFRDIPDLHFTVGLIVCNQTHVAARLDFDCTPVGVFLGLPVNGRRIMFSENVFYEFHAGKIRSVWSVIDKMAVEVQLSS